MKRKTICAVIFCFIVCFGCCILLFGVFTKDTNIDNSSHSFVFAISFYVTLIVIILLISVIRILFLRTQETNSDVESTTVAQAKIADNPPSYSEIEESPPPYHLLKKLSMIFFEGNLGRSISIQKMMNLHRSKSLATDIGQGSSSKTFDSNVDGSFVTKSCEDNLNVVRVPKDSSGIRSNLVSFRNNEASTSQASLSSRNPVPLKRYLSCPETFPL